MNRFGTLAVFLLFGVVFSALPADPPPALVNYQGVLRDENDQPRDGSFDMVFRFMTASAGGTEIMVDSHAAATGNAVLVSGGLFNVQLGGGTVSDGSGGGTYLSLETVFRDYGTVWLAIRVGGEDLSPRLRIISSAYAMNATNATNAGNAAKLDGNPSSWFLDTSAISQTKSSGLTLENSGAYGLTSSGVTAGAYLKDLTQSGYAYVGIGDTGISAYGNLRGGYFADSDSSGYAYAGSGDYGVMAYGNTAGGYFLDRDGSANAYIAYGNTGVYGTGGTAGGTFQDSGGTSRADVAYGLVGISASGDTEGGHFEDANASGLARAGYGDTGIWASGNAEGGHFEDADGSGMARVAYGDYGVYGEGNTAGGWFKDASGSGYANVGFNETGIFASGSHSGAHFTDREATSEAYLAMGSYGISATGNAYGGYFTTDDPESEVFVACENVGLKATGWQWGGVFNATGGSGGMAYLGTLSVGVEGLSDGGGGRFEDTDSGGWAYVGWLDNKVQGNGDVNFVQNHPVEKDRIIVYTAPEGDEAAVYTRGTARLINGEARVTLGPTFQWVANPDIGLTAHLTPRGGPAGLYVASLSTTELVVRGEGSTKEVVFDYLVYGLRIGFEETARVRVKPHEAFIPSMKSHRELYASHPELRSFNSLERFREMSAAAGLQVPEALPNAAALKAAVHEYDRAADPPVRELLGIPAEGPPAAGMRPPAGATLVSELASQPPGRAGRPAEPAAAAAFPRTFLPVSEPVEAGDLLAFDPVNPGSFVKSRTPADPLAVAIAAGPSDNREGQVQAPVYDTLYAAVKADASTGPIRPGDLLVSSALPGFVMKAPESAPLSAIVGKALDKLELGQGVLRVLVTLR